MKRNRLSLPPRAAWALLGLLAAGCGGSDGPRERIVLITLDTLRLDAFASLGNGNPSGAKEKLPLARTRAFAEQGRIFEHYYSATSTTQPTHATLFTGKHPWQHGVPRNGLVLADHHTTLAERLQQSGYTTGAAIASFPVHSQFGFHQGFDHFHEDFNEGKVSKWSGVKLEGDTKSFHNIASHVAERANQLLDDAGGDKQFFWFHFFDAHGPYGDTREGEAGVKLNSILEQIAEGSDKVDAMIKRARRLYDKDVRFLDKYVGDLLTRLEEESDTYRTHIIVVSDHGESFGEFGSMGHGKRLTPEQIHVPCFILSPDVEPGREERPVGTLDVHATLLALAGLASPTGRNLLEDFDDTLIYGMRRTFESPYEEQRIDGSVVEHDGLLFFVVDGDSVFTGNEEGMTVGDGGPEAPEDVSEGLRVFFEAARLEYEGVDLDEVLDPETKAKLEALGYTDGGDTGEE